MSDSTGESASSDAMPGVAPEPSNDVPPEVVEVDGETFHLRSDGQSGTHYDWVSGPNDGHGFSVGPTDGCSLEDHHKFIRDFLAQIDPATGFI